MIVVTSSGLITSSTWWATLDLDGNTVTLNRPRSDEECTCPPNQLVVAELRSPAEAAAFHSIAGERVASKARRFAASDWPSANEAASRFTNEKPDD